MERLTNKQLAELSGPEKEVHEMMSAGMRLKVEVDRARKNRTFIRKKTAVVVLNVLTWAVLIWATCKMLG